MSKEDLVEITKRYYDSQDADEFYYHVWGGENIHVGIYEIPGESIFTASKRTVQEMISTVKFITGDSKILDIGAGYGGSARYLASTFNCKVWCLNLSEKENKRNRQKNAELRMAHQVLVDDGSFEDMPYGADVFDIVWSGDAILHSNRKDRVFQEVRRVLKPGGWFIFTDPMQADNVPDGVLTPILERIHLEQLGSVKLYRELARENVMKEVSINQMPDQLVNHYSSVLENLKNREQELLKYCSQEFMDRMKQGLQHWIDGGKKGYLNWGIMLFKNGQ